MTGNDDEREYGYPNCGRLEADAVDLTTTPDRLSEIYEKSSVDPEFHRRVCAIIARHPSLPPELVSELFSDYPLSALRNPALPLLLLESPDLLHSVVESSLIEMVRHRRATRMLVTMLQGHPSAEVRAAADARALAGAMWDPSSEPSAAELDRAWTESKVPGLEGINVPDLIRALYSRVGDEAERLQVEAAMGWGKAAPDPNWLLNMTLLANWPQGARELLEAGVDPREPDLRGDYAWEYAFVPETVRLLLELGIPPQGALPQGEKSWLKVVVQRGEPETVRLLLERGADPNLWVPAEESALMVAARAGDVETARLLLDAGADIDAHYVRYVSEIVAPLTLAAADGHAPLLELLLERGAGIELAGATALYNAAGYWDQAAPRMVKRLLAAGVDPNGVICLGTPLHAAVRRNNLATASVLLAAGADPHRRCGTDPRNPRAISSPWEQAQADRRSAMLQLLEKGRESSRAGVEAGE